MKKKKLLVKDALNLMEDSDNVCVMLYAYGVYYGDTIRDNMHTVADCKKEMNFDCINALVTRIRVNEKGFITIQAEIVH